MRIIDKNQDYYDYLQDRDDTLVFDRRGSFLLTKEIFCDKIRNTWRRDSKYRFILLQCGATFWLFLVHITKYGEYPDADKPLDYEVECITSWKNYNVPRGLLKLSLITFNQDWKYDILWDKWNNVSPHYDYDPEKIKNKADVLRQAIDNSDIEVIKNLSKFTQYNGNIKSELTIPILKACGIANQISAEDMYHAIDEHFSLEKTASESTVAEGTTNKDKIINHGFDTKTSFRGK